MCLKRELAGALLSLFGQRLIISTTTAALGLPVITHSIAIG